MKKNIMNTRLSILMLICGSPLFAVGADVFNPIEQSANDFLLEGFGAKQKGLNLFENFTYGINLEAEYNNNIFLSKDDEESDLILRFGVPLEFSSGPEDDEQRLALSYTPTYEAYMDNSGQSNLEHNFNFSMLNTLPKTTFRTNVFAAKSENADRFISDTVSKTLYGLDFGVEYDLTGKTTLDFGFGVKIDKYEKAALFDTEQYDARLAWLYEIGSKTKVGPYVAAERVFVDRNASQTGLSLGVDADYSIGAKTTLIGFVGVERRTFSGAGNTQTNPELELAVEYELTGKTDLSASVYSRVTASFSDPGLAYDATGGALSLTHAATDKLKLKGALTYEYDDYFSVDGTAFSARNADYYTFRIGADLEVSDDLAASATLSYLLNESEDASRESNGTTFALGLEKKF
ncbi:MAG: hypothetical protein ACSHW7_15505 [Patiriisocius sp.]|uniref:hypothetical protein n=1 Tax=Patiriisocius sp. TaxID=2822396 RepID=UPI003EF25A7F